MIPVYNSIQIEVNPSSALMKLKIHIDLFITPCIYRDLSTEKSYLRYLQGRMLHRYMLPHPYNAKFYNIELKKSINRKSLY